LQNILTASSPLRKNLIDSIKISDKTSCIDGANKINKLTNLTDINKVNKLKLNGYSKLNTQFLIDLINKKNNMESQDSRIPHKLKFSVENNSQKLSKPNINNKSEYLKTLTDDDNNSPNSKILGNYRHLKTSES